VQEWRDVPKQHRVHRLGVAGGGGGAQRRVQPRLVRLCLCGGVGRVVVQTYVYHTSIVPNPVGGHRGRAGRVNTLLNTPKHRVGEEGAGGDRTVQSLHSTA